jgi:hypothetical protein
MFSESNQIKVLVADDNREFCGILKSYFTNDPVMRRISEIMDFDSVYIKNMILNNADRLRAFDLATYEFIKEKAKVDNHYVIRNWILD